MYVLHFHVTFGLRIVLKTENLKLQFIGLEQTEGCIFKVNLNPSAEFKPSICGYRTTIMRL